MTTRLDYRRVGQDALRAMMGLETYVRGAGLEPTLLELVKLRASYMNGCAYCVDMHTKDARAAGESEQRLYAVPVWRETPFFTARERAALALVEHVTLIAQGGVPDAVYDEAARQFPEAELAALIGLCVVINAWNRINVTCRATPQPRD